MDTGQKRPSLLSFIHGGRLGTGLSAGGLRGSWSLPGLADNNDFIKKPPLLAL